MAVSTFYLLKGMHSFIQNAMMKLDHTILPTKLPERMVKGKIWLECKFFKDIQYCRFLIKHEELMSL